MQSLSASLLLYAVVIALGSLLGRVKIGGVGFGPALILFTGLFAGHLGLIPSPEMLATIQNLGLILFVTCIGLQVGPSFFSSFRHGGGQLIFLAGLLIVMNVILLLCVYLLFFKEEDFPMLIGMMCGAVTNTPSLGAAEETLALMNYNGPDIATGYACAYPFAVVGTILALVLLQRIFASRIEHSERGNMIDADAAAAALKKSIRSGAFPRRDNTTDVVTAIFAVMLLGICIGIIPIPIPGCPVPLKLGLAGGPLIAAIILGRFGGKLHLDTHTTTSANHLLRDLGLALFLASVGIKAGGGFVEAILSGNGLLYMFFGFLITVVPVMVIGVIACRNMGLSVEQLMGLVGGATTDPPVLAFAAASNGSNVATLSYSMVYPFAMLTRVLVAQLLVVVWA